MGPYISLINAYDALIESGAEVCPIAHTYMTVHIAVLLNKKGEFLCAKIPDIKGELARVPCTDESGRRTCGDYPHLLHDNLCYVAPFGSKPNRHKAYISQLEEYTKANPKDLYAAAIYNYAKNGDILHDLKDIISNFDLKMPLDKANVALYIQDYMRGKKTEDELKQWIDKRYPGKWDGFINILKNGEVEN